VRTAGEWSASLTKRNRDGTLGQPESEWAAFDPRAVDNLLRAYRSLGADDFGEDRKKAESGVDEAEHSGGILRIRLKSSSVDRIIRVGRPSTNSGRWAIKDSRWAVLDGGDGTLYVLSPWTAGWATADKSKFEDANTLAPGAASIARSP
jgi:hypothetical protein